MVTNLMYTCFSCLVLAALVGILGVWIPDFWKSEIGRKLTYTFFILAALALGGAVILSFIPVMKENTAFTLPPDPARAPIPPPTTTNFPLRDMRVVNTEEAERLLRLQGHNITINGMTRPDPRFPGESGFTQPPPATIIDQPTPAHLVQEGHDMKLPPQAPPVIRR